MWSLPFTCFLGLITRHIYMPWHNWVCISMRINIHYDKCRNWLSCIHMPTDHPHYIVMYAYVHGNNHTHMNSRSLLIFFWFASTIKTTTTTPLVGWFIYFKDSSTHLITSNELPQCNLILTTINWNRTLITLIIHLISFTFGYTVLDMYFWIT